MSQGIRLSLRGAPKWSKRRNTSMLQHLSHHEVVQARETGLLHMGVMNLQPVFKDLVKSQER